MPDNSNVSSSAFSGTTGVVSNFLRSNGRRVARAALGFSLVFHLWHLWELPLVMTWDGVDYISLSKLFGSGHVVESWRYYRTPGYPFFLRTCLSLFGQGPSVVQLPNVI